MRASSFFLCRRTAALYLFTTMTNTLDLIDAAIADLEAKLHLSPGETLKTTKKTTEKEETTQSTTITTTCKQAQNTSQPDICKLEFKVGVITKVWVHPDADKLYCEEIDVGEEAPRQIASGLRPHFTEEANARTTLIGCFQSKGEKLGGI